MYKLCTKEKAVLQQNAFAQCLFEMMQDTPYDKISVRGLCEYTGLSRKIFYHLFDCKEDLLYALIDQVLRDYVFVPFQKEQGDLEEQQEELQKLFSYWRDQKVLLKVLEKNDKLSLLLIRSVEYVLHEDRDMLSSLGADHSPNSREIVVFAMSGTIGLILDWYASGYQKSVSEMAELFEKIIFSPIIHTTL